MHKKLYVNLCASFQITSFNCLDQSPVHPFVERCPHGLLLILWIFVFITYIHILVLVGIQKRINNFQI